MCKRTLLSCSEGQFGIFSFRMCHILIAIASEMFVVNVGHLEKCLLYVDTVSVGGIGKCKCTEIGSL